MCFVLLLLLLTLRKCRNFVSAASDVDPDNVAGQKTAEPAVVVEDAARQTAQEQSEEQPTVVTMAESAEEHPAPARTGASTPARDDEAARTPPPSSVAEEGDKAPTPPPTEERRAPTPPRAEASSPKGSPGRDKGPVIPVTTAGGSAEGEEAQAASDDEVEEIQGRPLMVASTFTCGANVGTISLVMRSSRRRRRPRGWSAQLSGSLMRLR